MPCAPLSLAYYGFDDPMAACARLRVYEPARVLGPAVRLLPGVVARDDGHAISAAVIEQADGILIQRFFPGPATAPVIEAAFASGKPVLYDTDDDFAALPPEHPFYPRLAPLLPHIRDTAARAACVTVSTPALAAVYAPWARQVRVLPNFLPDALWSPAAPPQRPVAAIGFAATPTHGPDLARLAPALARLAGQPGFAGRFVFYGCPPPPESFAGATVIPFATDYAAYAARLPRLGLAIGLAPLADTAFNRAKSAVKWQEYTAAGAACLCADLPPYREVVEHGATGWLVGPEPEAWAEAVARLASDAPLRGRLVSHAREALRARHRLSDQAGQYLDVWNAVARGGV
jgi:glycosyltransferase involved in cell wall biosynthesis